MNIHKLTASIAAVLLSASLFSCSSDDFFGKPESGSTNGISFGVSTENSAATRANKTDDGLTVARYTLRSDNSADTLCVRAVVTDGIGNNANKPATRAAMQTSMYNDFKVVAAVKENGNVGSQYYMNDVATKTGTNWVPSKVYYWPGSNRQLRFLAWAPTDAVFQSVPNSPNTTTLQYTTPAEAKNQRDLVAAATDFIDSPANNGTCTPVSLNFKHLCTAVIIKTGETMTAGTIKSVSLKGVKNSGTYDMVNSAWTLTDSKADFTISPNQATTSTTPNGTDLNAGESTFMLLPQTLGADSKLEVEFHDNISGKDRILTASLNGAEWPMGKTVTYRLSITPEYELNIENTSEMLDAHYIVEPIKVKIGNLEPNAKWTLTAKIDGEIYNSIDVSVLLDNPEDGALNVAKQGFWIDKYVEIKRNDEGEIISKKLTNQTARGTATVTGTGNLETNAYVFIPENIGNTDRNITITLKVDGSSDADAYKKTITQKCPSWNGNNVGYERFEKDNEGIYPFGFLWDRKVEYSYQGFLALLFKWVANSYKTADVDYLTTKYTFQLWFKSITTATIDYTAINNSLNVGMNTEDGLENTKKLYTFKNIGSISELENDFDNLKILGYKWQDKKTEGGHYETVKNFAAKMAVMRNKFNIEKREQKDPEGNKVIFYVPDIEENDIVWYLPASNEQKGITDTEYPLSGTYWSSTAADDNTHAYVYSSSGESVIGERMATHKIRAARRK
ncbi:fimbrillin family protein [uncultured Prevotella sp.]|uniref:fimbrillin family protein n=1 Tax=uncultured Prevotella sp. TaxID=159272 RepID=UPI0026087978|nr:fimbrillin family protein [uncultured Prevotella sp.]